jgi:iron complex outermembrane receptor protein
MALISMFMASGACSQTIPAASSGDQLQHMSVEDLANLQVTSVSKRPEALRSSASSIYVITAEDIRRSGYVTLPEVLRLAPNLEVARINGYSYSVTARGFNSPETANKLLVLIDGRSVYEPIGSGVLWQQIDVSLDNIDRIEVISGPGGTLWGANAVNGVINIISKPSSETQGLYLRATASPYKRTGTIRFGGALGKHAHFRVYADGFEQSQTKAALVTDTFDDGFRGQHAGFGIDGTREADSYTFKGDAYRNEISEGGGIFRGYDLLAGWARTLDNGSIVNLQAYADHDVRDEPTLFESRDTYSLEAQHAVALNDRHQFVWGGEIRVWRENFVSYNAFHFADPKTTISLASVFAQDGMTLRDNLKLTLGLKAENSSYSGLEWLPNVRLGWQRGNQMVWGSVSRAVRTPNRIERELEASGILLPAPDFESEKLTAYEIGWRAQPLANLSLSLSAFENHYDDLRTDGYPATIFPLVLQNGGRGTTSGLEGWATFDVTPNWRLKGGFNTLNKHFELKPGFNDLTNLSVSGQDPRYQAQIRSEWTVGKAWDIDVAMRTVGKVDTAPVPAYTEASVRVAWRLTDKLELNWIAGNLLHKRHIEVWDPSTASPRYSGRSVLLSLRYGY